MSEEEARRNPLFKRDYFHIEEIDNIEGKEFPCRNPLFKRDYFHLRLGKCKEGGSVLVAIPYLKGIISTNALCVRFRYRVTVSQSLI